MSYNIDNQYDHKFKSKYELMQESLYIANLFYIMNRTLWSSKSDIFYIIPSSWFEKWKAYTNYDYNISKSTRLMENINENKSFFDATEEVIKSEIENYMKNSFFMVLSRESKENIYMNSQNKLNVSNVSSNVSYPGYINNSSLVYEGYLCHRIEDSSISSMTNSYINLNLKENLCEGINYIIITKDIWEFFNMVYGGLAIMRYRIDISNKESIIEVKLKTLSIINLNIRNSKIEKSKFAFFSRGKSVKELKRHLYRLFFNKDKERIKEKDEEEHYIKKHIRLWIVDEGLGFNMLEEYIVTELEKNSNEYNGNISFPGILLDQFENSLIGEIDDLLSENTLVVLEHKRVSKGYFNQNNNFIFKVSGSNYIDIGPSKKRFYISNPSSETSLNEYFHVNINSPVGFYDSYTKYMNMSSQRRLEYRHNRLFTISDYFLFKYRKDIFAMVNSKKDKDDNQKESIMTYLDWLFKKEVDYYSKNLYMIYEKYDIINKFEIFYSKASKIEENTVKQSDNHDDSNRKDYDSSALLSRYDVIMKKRSKLKKETIQKEEKIGLMTINQCHDSLIENEKKCLYCNKASDIDYKCEMCCFILYCSETCMNKDSKFHKRKCKAVNS